MSELWDQLDYYPCPACGNFECTCAEDDEPYPGDVEEEIYDIEADTL
jgi:hypothetical protein